MLTRKAEDYLEVIYIIEQEKRYARVKDIAEVMNVKPASVSEMLAKLSREGYINYEKRGGVTLTDKGLQLARIIQDRHKTFIQLLKLLQIPESIAKKDAYKLEHHLHPKTIEQFKRFIEFSEKNMDEKLVKYLAGERKVRNPK